MTPQEISNLIDQKIKDASQKAQYSVTRTSVHTHNNIDSPNIQAHSVIGYQTLNGARGSGGVIDPVLLNGQGISFGETPDKTTNVTNIDIYPLPIIYGFGSTSILELVTALNAGATSAILATDYTLTAPVIAGATSATLSSNWVLPNAALSTGFSNGDTRTVTYTNGSANITWAGGISVGGATSDIRVATVWGGTTKLYGVKFSNDEIRNVLFTNNSSAVSWTPPLISGATTDIIQIGNSRFKGGVAPYGTAIVFRNDDDGILQLWIRTQPGLFTDTWASVDLNLSIVN